MNKGIFQDELKQADIEAIYKKESRNEKENYRTVSILSCLSKLFACCMYDELKDHFDKLLSKYQCGFRKGFSTQHCLLAMIEKLRKSLDTQCLTSFSSVDHLICLCARCLILFHLI